MLYLVIFSLFVTNLAAQTLHCAAAVDLHRQGKLADAIPKYQECLAAQPDDLQTRSNLGAALAQQGRFDEAIEQDKQALKGAPEAIAPGLHLNLALAFYKMARLPEAAEQFQAVLQRQPENRQAYILLAECRLFSGAPAEAVKLLEPWQAAHPDDLTVAYLLGSALLRSGNVQRGQQVLDRILRNGESAEGHMLLGVSMLQAGDFPGAVRELKTADTLRPNLPSLHSYYGQALLNTGDADAAVASFERELRANPADFDANLRLGQIWIARKLFDLALPLLERAAQVRPASAEVHDTLAALYTALNQPGEASRERALAGPRPSSASVPDGPAIGSLAPPFQLRRAASNDLVSLKTLLPKSPVVLLFGSYTCPQLRAAAPVLNRLSAKFGSQITFAFIYVSEAHAAGSWQSTINDRERIDLPLEQNLTEKSSHAQLCIRKLSIPYVALVDNMDRAVEKAYAAWPSRVTVVGKDGRIRFTSRLTELDFDQEALTKALTALLPDR